MRIPSVSVPEPFFRELVKVWSLYSMGLLVLRPEGHETTVKLPPTDVPLPPTPEPPNPLPTISPEILRSTLSYTLGDAPPGFQENRIPPP